MPQAKTKTAGSRSISTLVGGTRLDGRARVASHVALDAGILASQSKPSAINAGPTVMKMRGPIRAASVPAWVEMTARKIAVGTPIRPLASAL